MSLWKRIAAFSPEVEQRMRQYYDEKGLAGIRIYFAQWIEDKILCERINSSSADLYEQIAQHFTEELKQKLIALGNENLIKFKLTDICTVVTQIPAVDLYTHVRSGITKELQILDQMPQMAYYPNGDGVTGMMGMTGGMGSMCGVGGMTATGFGVSPSLGIRMGEELLTICSTLQMMRSNIAQLTQQLHRLQEENVAFEEFVNSYNQKKLLLNQQMVMQNELRVQEQYSQMLANTNVIIAELANMSREYDVLQDRVINELRMWQRNQALAGNGAKFDDNLDEIQSCIEMLLDVANNIYNALSALMHFSITDNERLNGMIQHVADARKMLVLSAFIVENQPPQVMKTNTKFASAVRWLIGSQLGICLNHPVVECIILSEAQAQRQTAQRTADESSSSPPHSSGEITNNSAPMEFDQQKRHFSASFKSMQLKKIKRAEKKGSESVMDEKFALLFYTSFVVDEYRIRVWTLSLPVVVIVHGNQEPQSWATITWDNAFSETVREPFVVPEKVSWSQLAYTLNTKFAKATGRPLTEENLNFLYEKLFRNDGMNGDHKDYITWTQFCKDPLHDRTFTFWDWFYAIIKLTKDHLLELWKAGLVIGFINKSRASEEILRVSRIGTFLLRFSDSELGGISVAFTDKDGEVVMVHPWTARDLHVRGLADRIQDLPFLHYAHPTDKPKDEVFRDFYTQRMEEQTTRDGYVANTIRAHVPAIEGSATSLSATPQHTMPSPHPQDCQMGNNHDYVEDIAVYLNNASGMDDGVLDWDDLP